MTENESGACEQVIDFAGVWKAGVVLGDFGGEGTCAFLGLVFAVGSTIWNGTAGVGGGGVSGNVCDVEVVLCEHPSPVPDLAPDPCFEVWAFLLFL